MFKCDSIDKYLICDADDKEEKVEGVPSYDRFFMAISYLARERSKDACKQVSVRNISMS